jgi:proline iminopeptidase
MTRSALCACGLTLAAVPASLGGQAARGEEGYLVTADSARLFYRVVGRGPDTLVALHGGPGVDLESIAADFAPLTALHTVIFYDQRGAGRSELPTDTLRLAAARQIADLDEVRRHFGLGRVTLVAHSYGPLLAASYALAHPDLVERMIFLAPLPPRRGDFWRRFRVEMAARTDSADAARMADADRRLHDPEADARQACRDFWAVALKPRLAEPGRTLPLIRSDLCASDPAGLRFGLTVTNQVVMDSWGDWNLLSRLRDLRVPTLVVHGEDDAIPMDLVEEWVDALPLAQLLRVPEAAHFPYVEQPGIVWPAVERFLTAHRR